jgi:outer membrane protein OmpA-like peptidoglycan-associated protein
MTDELLEILNHICLIVAAIFGLVGAVLIANRYVNIKLLQIPGTLVSAFFRGHRARDLDPIIEVSREENIVTLQGLAFVAFGFMLQAAPDVVALIHGKHRVEQLLPVDARAIAESLVKVANSVEAIEAKLQILVDQPKATPVDNASLATMASATATIAANSTELLKKLELAPKSDSPPSRSTILFETNAFTVKAGYDAVLDDWIEFLKAHPSVRVEVQGYSDNEGTAAENLFLSNQRAAAVAAQLRAQGASEPQLTCKGYGEANPIGDNRTPAGRDRNRRVELVYLQPWEQPSGVCLPFRK